MNRLTIDGTTIDIPTSESPCELWKIYFDVLAKKWNKDFARKAWLITWQSNGSTTCLTDSRFNNWLHKNDIDVSNAVTRIAADSSDLVGNIFTFGKNLTGTFSSLPKVALFLGIGVGGIILLLIFNTIKQNNLTVGDIATTVAPNPMSIALTKS